MSFFNISSYLNILIEGLQETQENTARLLFDSVVLSMSKPVYLSPRDITNLMKRKTEVHSDIKKASADTNIISDAEEYFIDNIINKINPNIIDDICSKICKLYSDDCSVPLTKKSKLDKLYSPGSLGQFICHCFLYALNRENKCIESNLTTDDIPLLSEVNYQCPKCNVQLIRNIKGNSVKKYEVTHIFPVNLDPSLESIFKSKRTPSNKLDSIENKIALCQDCSEEYQLGQNVDEYVNLFDIKAEASKNYQLQSKLSAFNLEEEIQDIVNGLANLNTTVVIQELRMNPILISKKIEPENFILTTNVTNHVLQYYNFIKKLFSDLDSYSNNNFNVIASEIKLAYESISSVYASQNEVFNKMSGWILSKLNYKNTDEYRIACDIVVAFFIQNCEVFHEITQ